MLHLKECISIEKIGYTGIIFDLSKNAFRKYFVLKVKNTCKEIWQALTGGLGILMGWGIKDRFTQQQCML